jgi:hypothetical protein
MIASFPPTAYLVWYYTDCIENTAYKSPPILASVFVDVGTYFPIRWLEMTVSTGFTIPVWNNKFFS